MFLSQYDIKKIGFKKVGHNVSISDKTSIYSPHLIEIGDNVRIDDFCILSPGKLLLIKNNVHIACHCTLIGQEQITLDDFSGLSSRVSLYSSSDDYSGEFMTNPTIPKDFTNVISSAVYIGKHVIVGAGSIILPGSILNEGVAVGALSITKGILDGWYIYGGAPCRKLKPRSTNLLEIEKKFHKNERTFN